VVFIDRIGWRNRETYDRFNLPFELGSLDQGLEIRGKNQKTVNVGRRKNCRKLQESKEPTKRSCVRK
jgi:hypothetical protein